MRAVSRSLAVAELTAARDVLDKWVKRLTEGVPGEDYPVEAPDTDPEMPNNPDTFYELLTGELQLVSGKCETLSTVIQAGG